MENFTIEDQVKQIRSAVLDRQIEDEVLEVEEDILDTVSKYRGAGAAFSSTLKDVAESCGFGDVRNPAKKGQLLVSSAIENFMINAFITAIVDSCKKVGIEYQDALRIAEKAYERELASGKTRTDIFREVFCG